MDEGETLGKYLRHQRESKKVSLREVAKSTRVREHILKAIEDDHYHLLPPTTYVKGFLLAYAKYLRLNPNEVLLRYEKALKGESVVPSPAQPQREPMLPQPSKRRQKRLWNIKQMWVIIGVVVAALIAIYFFPPFLPKLPVEPVSDKPVIEEKPFLPPSVPTEVSTSISEKGPFSLQLEAIEETWVSFQLDDQPEKEITLKMGEGISLQASSQIRILIGNAGGLNLIFNGKPLEKFGKSGEVITLLFTSQGVEVKPHQKSKPE